MKKASASLLLLSMLLLPSVTFANALIPAINSYRHTPVFYFVFVVIVCIETLLIRLMIRPSRWVATLWKVIFVNGVSSLAGYLLMHSRLQPEFSYVWQQAIPFFVLTLAVELPLLIILLRPAQRPRRYIQLVGLIANVLSYMFLLFAERPVEAVWLNRLGVSDEKTRATWTNTQMLAEASGLIYGTELGTNRTHHLRVFDPHHAAWASMSNSPAVHPFYWDVEHDLFAFRHYPRKGSTKGDITVVRLPDFNPITEISVSIDEKTLYGGEFMISPDGTRLAVIVDLYEVKAPLRGSRYQVFGRTCRVLVYDIRTGTLIGVVPRKARRGLCWMADSRRLLFKSLKDESLLELESLGKGWKKKYPNASKLFGDAPVYVYDLETESVEYFGDMNLPHLAKESGRYYHRIEGDRIRMFDPARGVTNDVQLSALGQSSFTVSPSGKHAIVPFTLTHPLGYPGYQTVIELNASANQFYLGRVFYRLDWTTNSSVTNIFLSTSE